jgi:hypothetical protein
MGLGGKGPGVDAIAASARNALEPRAWGSMREVRLTTLTAATPTMATTRTTVRFNMRVASASVMPSHRDRGARIAPSQNPYRLGVPCSAHVGR